MTHDYKRNGTTTLFAALDVLTGKVIGSCLPKHRHHELLKFLKVIADEVPTGWHRPDDCRWGGQSNAQGLGIGPRGDYVYIVNSDNTVAKLNVKNGVTSRRPYADATTLSVNRCV